MAKTKLLAAVHQSLDELAKELHRIGENAGSMHGVDEKDIGILATRWNAVNAAMAAMEAHINNWARRQNNPTLADRLKNAKNIFKDKSDLEKKRAAFATKFVGYKHAVEKLRGEVEPFLRA
jgi:hypothetical protein